jgi:transposase, IS5 family
MQGLFGDILIKSKRKRAVTQKYVSPNQMILEGFETPFQQKLCKSNRWVRLSEQIPWDRIIQFYDRTFTATEGRPPINGRVVLGSVIIKHMLNLTDREVILQIQENMFMQYFLGFSSFTNEEPFSHTMFVPIREKLSIEIMAQINEIILQHHKIIEENSSMNEDKKSNEDIGNEEEKSESILEEEKTDKPNKGKLLMDATVAPQNITFPTDLKLLNASREKSEEIIDKLYRKDLFEEKPRTYRINARKEFLNTNKKKRKTSQQIYKANGSQIRYLNRNINYIFKMLSVYENAGDNIYIPLSKRDLEYFYIIQKVYSQQNGMYTNKTKTVEDRIVSIHQPHVRPIVRGKDGKPAEFGSKIQLALVDGFSFLDKLSWDNFNESTCLKTSVEKYKQLFGFYPKEVLADQIYCTRANRIYLKERGIRLSGKPLGRPKKDQASSILVSPGERNPIEGKFGQAKVRYGMNLIKAKLKTTSESWIASIVLVLNLVNLTRRALVQQILYIRFLFNVSVLEIRSV